MMGLDKGFRSYRVSKSQNFDLGFARTTGPPCPHPGSELTPDLYASRRSTRSDVQNTIFKIVFYFENTK